MKTIHKINLSLFAFFVPFLLIAKESTIIVDQNGKGNFKTIQEAVNSLPDSSKQDRVIYIKNGIYNEKIYIGKNHVVLQGENRDKTIITGSIANGIYTCNNPNDKYSGIVNIDGDDVTIMTLTVKNTYGIDVADSTIVLECMNPETGQLEKRNIVRYTHQFALRVFKGTRLKVIDCAILSWGADTVAPWNGKTGMYYFKDCIMQGGTDFYCPRGWAYAENCTFICLKTSAAAMWHDGRYGQDMKSVFKNCKFEGPTGYKLGRYHHDAHFYFINCKFDKNLENIAIFKAATAKEVIWAPREYYFNCHREGGDFDWFRNNLDKSSGSVSPKAITEEWTFDEKWNPTKKQ